MAQRSTGDGSSCGLMAKGIYRYTYNDLGHNWNLVIFQKKTRNTEQKIAQYKWTLSLINLSIFLVLETSSGCAFNALHATRFLRRKAPGSQLHIPRASNAWGSMFRSGSHSGLETPEASKATPIWRQLPTLQRGFAQWGRRLGALLPEQLVLATMCLCDCDCCVLAFLCF